MLLKRTSIYLSEKADRPNFYFYTGGIEDLYFKNIGKVNIDRYNYINIFFSSEKNEEGKVVTDANFLNYYTFFNFYEFEKLSNNFEKKKNLLNTFHQAMLKLCDLYNLNKEPFELSFEICIQKKLINEWLFENKLFKSPNHEYYMGLYYVHDLGSFEIYEVLYNKNKQELKRRRCFQNNVPVFSISWASWEGSNETFYYKFNGPAKVFECRIDDLLAGKEYDLSLCSNPSQFFKKERVYIN